MKKFVLGVLTGYLLTSIFSISAPPLWTWGLVGLILMLLGTIGMYWYRVNDDMYEGDF